MLQIFGLDNLLSVDDVSAPDEVRALLDARERARAERDYGEADRLRDEIRALGWEVRDSSEGPELLPVG
jgi:cysteinyl-tRNA synthetase